MVDLPRVQVEEIETLRREQVTLLRVEIGSGDLGLHKIAAVESLLADVEFVFNVPCRV
jgi:hypothetical protein